MRYTNNKGLKLPGYTDPVDIEVINENFEALDNEVGDIDAKVRAVKLTGLSTAINSAITATDTVLSAPGKLQAQITSVGAAKQDAIVTGTTAQYYRGDKTWQDLATAARAVALTGLSTATSTAITATDTLLTAPGKLQAQITALSTAKEATIPSGTTAQFYRGDKTWQDFSAAARAVTLTGLSTSDFDEVVATDTFLTAIGKLVAQYASLIDFIMEYFIPILFLNNNEPLILPGTTAQYYRGDKSWQDLATASRAVVLTGLSTSTSTAITATDTLLSAPGKLQAQITALSTSKANTSASISATLTTANWTGTAAPFTQAVTVSGITTTTNCVVGVASTRTTEQYQAAVAGQIQATAQATNQITFKAEGTKPTVNIPITVLITY